jgi:hypothetical protein
MMPSQAAAASKQQCLATGCTPKRWLLLNTIKKQSLFRADTKKPGTPFGPGTLRKFQFAE